MTNILELNEMTNRFFILSKEIKSLQDRLKVFVYDIENNSNYEDVRPYLPKESIAKSLTSLTDLRKDLFNAELTIQEKVQTS